MLSRQCNIKRIRFFTYWFIDFENKDRKERRTRGLRPFTKRDTSVFNTNKNIKPFLSLTKYEQTFSFERISPWLDMIKPASYVDIGGNLTLTDQRTESFMFISKDKRLNNNIKGRYQTENVSSVFFSYGQKLIYLKWIKWHYHWSSKYLIYY